MYEGGGIYGGGGGGYVQGRGMMEGVRMIQAAWVGNQY